MMQLLVLSPLLLAALAVLFSKRYHGYIALGGSIASLLLLPFLSTGLQNISWFSVAGYTVSIATNIFGINLMLLAIVLIIGPVVFAYSIGFMNIPSEQKRFYLEMLVFEASMAVFAIAGSLILLFIAWEFLSVSSYLLIGFWYKKGRVARAARKAISMVFIGDVALLASIVLIWNVTGSLSIQSAVSMLQREINSEGIAAIALLFVALFTKSAQFPFHEWLADAMEGPTPVSAYLHSSTMVKAGVFAAIVLFPIFSSSKALYVFLVVGLLTAVIAMFNAMRERHIKRVLAYSTVQELALMFVAVGGGAIAAAIYFFFAQSFYKVLLFLDAGLLMKGNGNKEHLDELSGLKSNRLLYFTTLFGVLALAGFVPFDGFFANSMIGAAFYSNMVVYATISLIGFGTSFYILRWFYLPQKKEKRDSIEMRMLPNISLYAAFAAMLLLFAASFGYIFLMPLIQYGLSNINIVGAAIETVVVAVGAALAYLVYLRGFVKSTPRLAGFAYSSNVANRFYSYAASFSYMLGEGCDAFDLYVNNFFEYIGHLSMLLGAGVRELAYGKVWFYSLLIVAGLACLLVYAMVVS